MPDRSKVENGVEEQVRPRPATPAEEAREPWPEETEEPSRRERARSYFREHPYARWVLLLLIVVVIAAVVYTWHYYSIRESTDDAEIGGHIAPVSARVHGTVISVDVEDNQYVDRGTVLVQLDPKDYEVALQRAQAQLANAQAAAEGARTSIPITTRTTGSSLSTAQAALNAARQAVDVARARVREAQANYNKVAADLRRAEMLIAKDEISRQQYDAAVASDQAAQATMDAAHAAQASAQSHVAQAFATLRAAETAPQQVAVIRSRAAEADAAVKHAQAEVQQAELNLQYTTVRAPFAGTVSKRSAEVGQVVAAGQPLFALVNLEDIYVTANFKETDLQHMCPGQPASIHVDAYDHDYKGHVDSFSGATGARFSLLPPENATGNYVKVVQRIPVKIVFEKGQDPNHLLRPGMSVEPTVLVDQPCTRPFGEAGSSTNPGNRIPGDRTQPPAPAPPPAAGAPQR